ncbi:MAG: GntR family transcriptional regulator [Anaerococcus sp.]|nr:GntR family transcriptional regulator [Anaerococcus sp.]
MFDLNFNSDTPLYMQIVESTKTALASGFFKDGDRFPSVRDLSKSLGINQTTVSKAFKELDRLGIIESKPGVGTFIRLDDKKLSLGKERFERRLRDDFKHAIFLGYRKDEIEEIFVDVERGINENKS